MKCIKDQCRSPVACGGFGYCRELNFGWDYGHDLYCTIGNKLLALGVTATEGQVEALTHAVLYHIYGGPKSCRTPPIIHDDRHHTQER